MSVHVSESTRLAYTTPNLFVHGTIEKMVQSLNQPGTNDAVFTLVAAPCQSGQVPNNDGIGCHAPCKSGQVPNGNGIGCHAP